MANAACYLENLTYIQGEDEVLFPAATSFLVKDISEKSGIWEINLSIHLLFNERTESKELI